MLDMKEDKKAKITNQDLLDSLSELEKISEITIEDKRLIQQLKHETEKREQKK
jgi:hypothetical protein